jgi:hypothetical protein
VWFAGHTRGPLPPSSFPGRKTDLRPAKHANHAKRGTAAAEAAREQNFFLRSARPARAFSRQFVWFAGHTRGPLPPSSFPGRKTDLRPAKHANHAKRAPPQRKQQENRNSFFGQLVRRGLFRVSSCGSRAILGVPFPQAVSPDGKPTFGPLNTLTTRRGHRRSGSSKRTELLSSVSSSGAGFFASVRVVRGPYSGSPSPKQFPRTENRPSAR